VRLAADIPAPWDFISVALTFFLLGAAAVGVIFISRLVRAVEFLKGLLDELVHVAGDAEARRQEWEDREGDLR
jgi:hypothetical protein